MRIMMLSFHGLFLSYCIVQAKGVYIYDDRGHAVLDTDGMNEFEPEDGSMLLVTSYLGFKALYWLGLCGNLPSIALFQNI